MGLECKSKKSRNTWGNRQIWPWSTKRSRAKANRVLPREFTGHSKHPLPTTQEKTLHMTSPDGQHRNQIDYILCSQRWRSSTQSAETRLGAECGSDQGLLIAKFRLKLKKVGKTTRPFNSVQFSRSVVSDSLPPHELQHTRPPCPSPRKRNAKKARWLSDEALQIAEKRREGKGKGEKEDIPI